MSSNNDPLLTRTLYNRLEATVNTDLRELHEVTFAPGWKDSAKKQSYNSLFFRRLFDDRGKVLLQFSQGRQSKWETMDSPTRGYFNDTKLNRVVENEEVSRKPIAYFLINTWRSLRFMPRVID